MKHISDQSLRKAYAESIVPVKKLTPYSVAVWSAAANLKASIKINHGVEEAWKSLQRVIDDAISTGNSEVFEEQTKAMANSEVEISRKWTIRQDGCGEIRMTAGDLLNKPRRPVTLDMVSAIMRLQRNRERAPTRGEILDEMDNSIDETELCRQLTNLGWNDLLP